MGWIPHIWSLQNRSHPKCIIWEISFYFQKDLNTCFHIEFYRNSPQISMSSWKYISLIAGLTRPMWMMCDPCHNYWDAVVINSIFVELKTWFLRNLPVLSLFFRGMPYFGLFTHLKFSGFDGNIWWWFCCNTESHWEQGDYKRTYQRRSIQPNEEKLNDKENIKRAG